MDDSELGADGVGGGSGVGGLPQIPEKVPGPRKRRAAEHLTRRRELLWELAAMHHKSAKEKEEELSKRLIESLLFEDEQDRIQLAEERKRAQEKPPEPQIQPAPVRSTTTPTEKLAGWERVADERKEAERQELERLQRVRIMEDSLLNSDQLVQREINSLMQRIEEAEIKYSVEASDEGLATTFLGLEGLGELKQVLRRYAYVRLKRVIKPELRERFERQWLSYKRQYGGGSNLAAPTYTLIISKLFSLLYL